MTVTLLHILMAVHTLIGAVSTGCLVCLYWAAWHRKTPKTDKILVFALAWPLANLTLMALNGMACPLQNAARVLAGSHGIWVRDMYLVPESWLRIVPWTYPIEYVIGVAAVFWRMRKAKNPETNRRPGTPRLY
jgi:hypothetical protein